MAEVESWPYDTVEGARFVVKRRVGKGQKPWREPSGVKGTPLPLHHDQLPKDGIIVITEGERDRDAVQVKTSYAATTWPGGASVPHLTDWSCVRDRNIVLWPDRDEPGFTAMQRLTPILHGIGCQVNRVEPPPSDHQDGWGAADADPDQARALIDAARPIPRALEIVDAASFDGKEIPPRKWLIPALIPKGDVTLVNAHGGVGKSLLLLQLCAAVQIGTHWIGRQVDQGNSLFYSCEDDLDELHRRLNDIKRSLEFNWSDLQGMGLIDRTALDSMLSKRVMGAPVEPTELARLLEEQISVSGASLVVIDGVSDTYHGSEIDRGEVTAFIGRVIRPICLRTGTTVVLVGHASKTDLNSDRRDASGSSAWHNKVRSRLFLAYDDDDQTRRRRILSLEKSNYGESGAEIAIRWQDGAFVAEDSDTGIDRNARRSKAERVFMALLSKCNANSTHVSASPQAGENYAPKLFSRHPASEGVPQKDFINALRELTFNGDVHEVRRGRRQSLEIKNTGAEASK